MMAGNNVIADRETPISNSPGWPDTFDSTLVLVGICETCIAEILLVMTTRFVLAMGVAARKD